MLSGAAWSGDHLASLPSYEGDRDVWFLEAVAVTKVLNLFSSLVATAVFALRGLIDWKLGLILGVASFAGAAGGADLARNLSNHILRQIFLLTVIALAGKTLA
jgi:uncharacterized protein